MMLSRRYSARRVAMAVLLVGPTDDGLLGSRGTARERWSYGRKITEESWPTKPLSWMNHGLMGIYHGFLIGFIRGTMGFIMTVYEFGRI